MKKFIALLLLTTFAFNTFAQTDDSVFPMEKKNEISISYGPINSMTFLEGFVGIFVAIGESIGHSHRENVSYPGVFIMDYHRQLNPTINVGVKALYRTRSYDLYSDDNNSFRSHNFTHSYAILPSIQFNYINEEYIRLYSGLDLGVCLYQTYNSSLDKPHLLQTLASFNLTLVGIKFGKDVYGLAEANIGSDALIKAGVGMRF